MFSKIVPAFNPDNVRALGMFLMSIFITLQNLAIYSLGPLVFIALLYEAIGILCAWIIKQSFWVPHQFRYGILVAGGWANVGDIRESIYIADIFWCSFFLLVCFANVATSVIMSVTGAAPFNGSSDQNLSVAYISAFILVFLVIFFCASLLLKNSFTLE